MKRHDRCPKCGGTSGVYFKEWQLWNCCYTWDGKEDDGDSSTTRGGNMMYCQDCDRPVMRASTFFEAVKR